jgi:hypothetical protein
MTNRPSRSYFAFGDVFQLDGVLNIALPDPEESVDVACDDHATTLAEARERDRLENAPAAILDSNFKLIAITCAAEV